MKDDWKEQNQGKSGIRKERKKGNRAVKREGPCASEGESREAGRMIGRLFTSAIHGYIRPQRAFLSGRYDLTGGVAWCASLCGSLMSEFSASSPVNLTNDSEARRASIQSRFGVLHRRDVA